MQTEQHTREKLLLAFANTSRDSLMQLQNELQAIRDRALGEAGNSVHLSVVERSGATYRTLADALFSGDTRGITMLHYSGHSTEAGLQVERNGRPETIEPRYLRQLLKTYGKLRFVFLNSCYSRSMATSLVEAGVPYVLGTISRVSDEVAAKVAYKFYQYLCGSATTIEEAFELTRAYFVNEAKNEARESHWRSFITEAEEAEDFPWQMFKPETVPDEVRNWTLVPHQAPKPAPRAAPPAFIPEEKAYVCNRHKYMNIFEKSFDLQTSSHTLLRKVNHYLIAGEERHSPLGLARKLVFEKITQFGRQECLHLFRDRGAVPIVLRRNHISARSIASEIYRRLADPNDPHKHEKSEIRFADLLALPQVKSQAFVILALELDADNLTPEVTAAIRSFIIDFCQHAGSQTGKGPSFLFFWNILYKAGIRDLLWFLGGSPLTRILKSFRDIYTPAVPAGCPLWVLNEVDRPPEIPDRREIDQWFDNHLNVYRIHRPDDEIYQLKNVKKLENRFFELIQHANNTLTTPLR